MEINELIDSMFPYYEDMSDIEEVQTTHRRIGARLFSDELFKSLFDWIKENNIRYPNPDLGPNVIIADLKKEFKI